ncbi:RNA-binding protein [Tritrichomonas foetus]|uniref:RNA-binding protein n=1 Tax=Tritrichomonas foetus TaxID=1144522 RepID=A0A1J4K357_9EUKA|nr:RNA-binding protein [Tritrichomonas foetus]|eukprot:OHT04158.1 RNA-binding protein [Tritrichomonas foetus]
MPYSIRLFFNHLSFLFELERRFWLGHFAVMSNVEVNTVFVRNLNYQTTQENLTAAFQKFGEVKNARIIKQRFRGEVVSRGIGFVEFASEEQARAALSATDLQLDGRKLSLQQARPRIERKRDTAFIRGIKEGTTVEHVKAAFAQYKPVDARIVRTNNDRGLGFGFVKFESTEARDNAVKASRTVTINGEESQLRFARLDFDAPPRRRFRGRRRRMNRAPRSQ